MDGIMIGPRRFAGLDSVWGRWDQLRGRAHARRLIRRGPGAAARGTSHGGPGDAPRRPRSRCRPAERGWSVDRAVTTHAAAGVEAENPYRSTVFQGPTDAGLAARTAAVGGERG